MSDTPPIRVKGIDHITIVVKDLDRTRAFYVDVIGMQEVPRPDFGFPGLWFQAGSTQIHLNVEGPEGGRAGLASQGGSNMTRGHHYAFLVDDAVAAARRIEALGLTLAAEPRSRPDGAIQMYVRDPDDYLIEVGQATGALDTAE